MYKLVLLVISKCLILIINSRFLRVYRLAQHCNDNGLEDLVFDIAGLLAAFAVRRLTPFLRQNGGWPTLCDAFPMQSDYEATMWTSLLVTGLGLTTVAAFVALMR